MADNIQDTEDLIEEQNISNAVTLSNLCREYIKYSEYNVPLPRYTPISPYGGNTPYTKYDLDMRRKAEVLKYKSLANQENGTTKSQKLSFLFNSTTRLKHIIDRSTACENKISSSTACDVPGPPVNLYLDNNVPLYNYNKIYTFGDSSNTVEKMDWDYAADQDIAFDNKLSDICLSIVYNSTKRGITTYSFQTPIALYIEGTKTVNGSPFAASVKRISVQLVSVKMSVLYADKQIKYFRIPVLTYPKTAMTIELPDGNTRYIANKYIGSINVSSLVLSTQPQYVYDVYFTFTMKTTLYAAGGSVISGQSNTTVSQSVIANLGDSTDPFYFFQDGCKIIDPNLPASVPLNVTSVPPNKVYNK